jgi:uracil-DNA glycosylase
VLVVGGLAVRRLLGLPRLTETIGRRYALADATAVPLPHPSGASGWLNDYANRTRLEDALALVREELVLLSLGAAARAGTRTRRG